MIYVKIVKSKFYDSIAVSHGGRTVVLTPTAVAIIEGGQFAAYRIRKRDDGIELEPLKSPSDAPLLFVPEPGAANGFIREVKDGKLYARRGNVVVEVGEVREI
jgi:hypothetical protein